jgi:hypothetical protein
VLVGIALVASCGEEAQRAAPSDPHADALARLRAFEAARRDETDFRTVPTSDEVLGPDPVAVRPLPGGPFLVGLLRGRSAVVLLDGELREVDRAEAPASPTGLAVTPAGEVFVSGELDTAVARYAPHDGRLGPRTIIPLDGVRSVRAIAYGPERILHLVEDHDHRLLTVSLTGKVLDGADRPIGLAPRTVLRTPRYIVVSCVLSHEVVVLPADARGIPRRDAALRIAHDGPFWAVDAVEVADGLLLAMGGVEDHPLDRRQGSFGYIDSFAYVYHVNGTPAAAQRLVALNVSALGVVTPKVVTLAIDGDRVHVRLVGYGDVTVADLDWASPRVTRKRTWPPPEIATHPLVPGTVMEARLGDGRAILADPLLDAWIVDDGTGARVVPIPGNGPPRDVEARIGEALLFTTLIAPWNRTKGSLSRFTCETCHFEGYVDGRIHDTGRGDVQVTTRPLLGLFNDRPYFSRALDPDLTAVAHNEFRVAGLRSRHDPWFALGTAQAPWLAYLGVGAEPLSPETLRRALMEFLMAFTHRPNPTVLGRSAWSAEERGGAELFRDLCESCHQARLVTDRADSRVSFDEWERLVMTGEGPLVWARDTYERTGVVPYVHAAGTRVPSLRRLYKKRPYFTNGSAPDLDAVLRRATVARGSFLHEGATPGNLDGAARAALRAFLDLL